MHDTLLPDGDLGTDLDAINPSLTDFDFQGELGMGGGRWDRPADVWTMLGLCCKMEVARTSGLQSAISS